MSTLTITIETGNAAFDDGQRNEELARIIRNFAADLKHDSCTSGLWKLHDYNGNECGSAYLTPQSN